MAIVIESYVNVAVKKFDDSDKYMGMGSVKEVVDQATADLSDIRKAIIDFATENQEDIRKLYQEVTSEMGSKRNYRMQSTDFAKSSFDEYIEKVISILAAVKNGSVPDEMCLNAGFFERDRGFAIALFSTDENEAVQIPAEDAFEELKYMQELVDITEEYIKQIIDKSSVVPEKKEVMDGVYAKQYETSVMAIKLMATSMVRFCALLLKHVVTDAARLYRCAVEDQPCTEEDCPEKTEVEKSDRWAIFL